MPGRSRPRARHAAGGRHPLISGQSPLSSLCRSALSLHRCPMMRELGSCCKSLPRGHGSPGPGRVSWGLSRCLGSSGCVPTSQGRRQRGSAGPPAGLAWLLQHPRLAWLGGGGAAGLHEAAASAVLPPHPPRREPNGRRELPSSAGVGRSWAVPAELARPEAHEAQVISSCGSRHLRAGFWLRLCWWWGLFIHLCYPQPWSRRWQEGMDKVDNSGPTVSLLFSRGSHRGSPGGFRFSRAKPGTVSRANSVQGAGGLDAAFPPLGPAEGAGGLGVGWRTAPAEPRV